MTKTSPATEPFFSHDISAQSDKSIKKLIKDMGYEGYGLFWAIVEFMHKNELMYGEEDLVVNSNYTEKIVHILNNYDFFRLENGYYISDRILRNIEKQEKQSKQNKNAVEIRWLLSAFDKEYLTVFGQKPDLDDTEIEKLKTYAKRIPNLKSLLPDIIYSLKKLNFKTEIGFKPGANWLLKDNNLSRILNGEFGKLQHRKTEKEIREEEEKQKVKQIIEETFDINAFNSKTTAIDFIVKNNQNLNFLHPDHKKLLKKFDITTKELELYKENNK